MFRLTANLTTPAHLHHGPLFCEVDAGGVAADCVAEDAGQVIGADGARLFVHPMPSAWPVTRLMGTMLGDPLGADRAEIVRPAEAPLPRDKGVNDHRDDAHSRDAPHDSQYLHLRDRSGFLRAS